MHRTIAAGTYGFSRAMPFGWTQDLDVARAKLITPMTSSSGYNLVVEIRHTVCQAVCADAAS